MNSLDAGLQVSSDRDALTQGKPGMCQAGTYCSPNEICYVALSPNRIINLEVYIVK